MAWYNPADWPWDAIGGPLSLAGTGFGLYSNWQNNKAQQAAYNAAQAQAANFQNTINNFYKNYSDYQNRALAGSTEAMGQILGIMNQPLNWQDFYKPFTDYEIGARRRGITAQQALRTNGNEGNMVDALVAEGVQGDESARIDKAIDAATRFKQSQMMGIGPLAQLAMGRFVAPPSPIQPYFPPYPNYGNMMGASDSFGQFLALMRQRQAAAAQQSQSDRLAKVLERLGETSSPYGNIRYATPSSSVYESPYPSRSYFDPYATEY